MGNARRREPRPRSLAQSNSQVTALTAQVAELQGQIDVDDSRVPKCTYGAGTLMLILSSTTTFDWVSNELCSRFKLKLGHFELKYSFTDCSNCLLESDDDLKIMFVAVPRNDNFAQDEDTCKNSSVAGIVDSSAAFSSCLSMDFDGISSEFGNDYFGIYGSYRGRKYLSTDWECYITHEGQKFEGGVCEFRDKLAKYLIENDFKTKYLKNELRCVTVVCAKKESNGCKWHVHVVKSNVNGFLYIKNLNNVHSCSGLIREKRNKAMGCRLVSSIVKDKVRSNPLVRPIELITNLKDNYGLDIPYDVEWPSMSDLIVCLTVAKMVLVSSRSLYVLRPPLMVFDGVGLYCSLMVFPIAFAIVSSETVDNWRWFMQRISEVLVVLLSMLLRLFFLLLPVVFVYIM
ncbi:uncharacterized protein LOC109949708 [Prunus persica]|uniref:uncharacterized protein LOC109949708 n=1 Tax=Prunus persica TaxID=3760 RepID=UPI0009ABAA52|nr:uncharacterized protein LOC109949708 [Prunus persica]